MPQYLRQYGHPVDHINTPAYSALNWLLQERTRKPLEPQPNISGTHTLTQTEQHKVNFAEYKSRIELEQSI